MSLLSGETKPWCWFFSGTAAVSFFQHLFYNLTSFSRQDWGEILGCPSPSPPPPPQASALLPFPVCLLFGSFPHLCHLAWHCAHSAPLTGAPGKQADGVGTRAGAWQLSTPSLGHCVCICQKEITV